MYNKEKQWIINFYICENINIFGYLGARGGGGGVRGGVGVVGGTSIIRLGPSWFTSTHYLIIIYMSNIEEI